MMKISRSIAAVLVLGVLCGGMSACKKKEGPLERAGKEMDKAIEKTGQQIEKAVDKTGEKLKDAAKDSKK